MPKLYLPPLRVPRKPSQRGHFAQPQLPDFAKWGKIERVSMRGVRRKTAEHLAEAWNTIPHVTQHDRADITELEQLRARFAPKAEEAGGKMTVTAIALKVCASALKVFPQFNASIDIEKEEIVYKQYISIGVAARYRSRLARAGHSRRGQEEHRRAGGRSCRSFRKKHGRRNSRLPIWKAGHSPLPISAESAGSVSPRS